MTKKHSLGLIVVAIAVLGVFAGLAAQDQAADPGRLTLDRIFASREFSPERFGPARWMSDGASYTTLEPSAEAKDGRDLVLYRAETGRREVLVSAAKLVPSGAKEPLAIENYAWSPDGKVLIVFTNSQRVWRQNTRGDFWTYELASGRLRQLGTGFEPSSLMFAKLSPDGLKAAYVVKNNIYVEDLASGRTTQLTFDGAEDIINGTSDWVNEEEFSIRDGFRWSPDSRSIAFWQFDTHDVPVFTMINNTDTLYPKVTAFKHPKPGQVNSAPSGSASSRLRAALRSGSGRPAIRATPISPGSNGPAIPARSSSSISTACRTRSPSSSATPRRARPGASSPTRTRPGWRSWMTSSGSTAAGACSG